MLFMDLRLGTPSYVELGTQFVWFEFGDLEGAHRKQSSLRQEPPVARENVSPPE